MDFGFAMAKEIGRLDIGQTVVVKDRALMAVEAIEGLMPAFYEGEHLAKVLLSQKRQNRRRITGLICQALAQRPWNQ